MRIGIFGGSFDPIHTAHVAAASTAREQLRLDRVLFVVSGEPPDGHRTVASYAQRLRMTELALSGLPWAEASDAERETRYTADTVFAVKKLYPGAELFLLIGEDKLASFPNWYQAGRVMAEARIAVISRPYAYHAETGDGGCAEKTTHTETVDHISVRFDGGNISSTDVRCAVRQALPTVRLLPGETERYIYEEGLYLPPREERIRKMLKQTLTPSRYRHVMGTVRQAIRLSGMYAPTDAALADKARLAALLHDCAKQFPYHTLRRMSGDVEPATEQVLHAFAGAVMAKTVYGIRDDDVLQAIYRHCTGDREMTLLDMIIYLADLTEPGRMFPGVERYREALALGPEHAMGTAVCGILALLSQQGNEVHPATLRAEAWLNEEMRQGRFAQPVMNRTI